MQQTVSLSPFIHRPMTGLSCVATQDVADRVIAPEEGNHA
jgi:hypothetical protein